MVLFPGAVLPIVVRREESIAAFAKAKVGDRVAVFAHRASALATGTGDLYTIGTTAQLLSLDPTPDGSKQVALVRGDERVRLVRTAGREPYLEAIVEVLLESEEVDGFAAAGMVSSIRELMVELVSSSRLPQEILPLLESAESPGQLCDFVGAALPGLAIDRRQRLLAAGDVNARLEATAELLAEVLREREVMATIRAEVDERFDERKREALLREHLEVIQERLGESDEQSSDIEELRGLLSDAGLPEVVAEETERELARLRHTPLASPAYAQKRERLEWIAALPWTRSSAEPVDVDRAAEVLERDHHGLEKVKERVLEYLSVLQLKRELRGPSLCLVGPPGVGKTSLGRSIAEATGRTFARMSLGGCGDEAEIRGHRSTYIGALPGQIIRRCAAPAPTTRC
jgi:ATP-dependent Lon protease